jgi:magnesium transporter
MAADDAAAALRHMPEEPLEGLLGRLTAARAEELRRLLAYPPKTVGGLMTPDVRTCSASDGLDDIRAALALHPPRLEGLLTVFEVDERGRLRGAITPLALIAGRREPVEVPALRAGAPVDEALEAFALNDLLAVPVVDEDGTLLGAVAVDDVIEELLVERLPGGRRYSFPTRAPA